MSEHATPSGPDLAQGVALSDLADGAMLAGRVGEEAVLLARRGSELFAVGAHCTHYGGPLAEGIMVGDTVRCPWHHACFSLRTGAPMRPPALNPIKRWRVEESGGKVFVRETLPELQPPALSSAGLPVSVVIVGGGAAGNAAAETLRREGYPGPITILSADPAPPVDRPNLSKDYLAGTAQPDWIPLRPPEFYAEHRIDLRLGTPVVSLDTVTKTVTLSDGTRVAYGALLLATGAVPVRLKVPGADLPHVHVLRTLADSDGLIAAASSARRCVVVGASFIGLEVAAALRHRGLEVHVVAPETRPLERVLGAEFGDMVKALHESKGVVFHLGPQLAAIEDGRVRLSTGEVIEADLVVTGVGVRPNLALAEAAGLAVDRGVSVDSRLRTSAPDVFAAGDIARWPDHRSGQDIRVEHWVLAERQGEVAARNILGRDEAFSAAAPFFWSQHYDVVINYVGHAEKWDRIEIDGDPGAHDCTVSYWLGGRRLAVATVGRDLDNLRAELALEAEGGG